MICGECSSGDVQIRVWVRHSSGGRRKEFFFCNEVCKEKKLGEVAKEGFAETFVTLGWDVFIPMWEET